MRGRRRGWSDEQLRAAVAASASMAGTLRALGLVPIGGNYRTARLAILRLGLDTPHWTGRGWRRGDPRPVIKCVPLERVLTRDSTYNRQSLKHRLLSAGLLAYRCAECGIREWRGRPLALDLDHVNGGGTDNRLENVRLLCPNCHSQTPTYRGRNKGKCRNRVSEPPGWRNWFTRLP